MTVGRSIVPLGEVIRQRKEFIEIDDLQIYKRARVQLHAKGIVLRDIVEGNLVKTKRQQVSRAGEFLVAEIDAKVGGFGMVPDELDGAIVSSHYFLFHIDQTKLERRFLDFYIRTPSFRDQVEAQGSTNYAAIRPAHVLGYQIPLPPLAEQRRIVARIEELVAQIEEARRLRNEAVEEGRALAISIHIATAGNRTRKVGDLLTLDEDSTPIESNGSYPQVGVRSFGAGLFPKGAVAGTDTTYRNFNRLYSGAIVLSQVKGWEGAIAACPAELEGWFVSPEYRTFRCVPTEAIPGYLAALITSEWFWGRFGSATRGVGARRERTRPEQFLEIEIPVPDLSAQRHGERIFEQLRSLNRIQAQTAAELDALLPAILDRAFKGEL
jgi:type I restriction enzyme S subunit